MDERYREVRRPVIFLLSISIEGIKIAVFKELDKLALFFFSEVFGWISEGMSDILYCKVQCPEA